MDKNNQLTIVVKESGLSQESKVEELMRSFTGYFKTAQELAQGAREIVVTDEAQTDLMLAAREKRLELKNVRVEVEKTRKELKEQSLREGRAIDGVANVIKALIVPVEEHLEKQEKYAELKEAERLEKRHAERVEKLSKYVDDVSLYTLKDMSNEAFKKLLESSKVAYEAQEAAKVKAAEDRAAEEAKQRKFNERRLELAPYADFIDRATPILDLTDEAYQELLDKAKAAKKTHDDEQEKIRVENEKLRAKAEEERVAKEKAEAKLREEREAQLKKEADQRAKEEAEQRARDEAEKKALLAPDKEKLLELAKVIQTIKIPAIKNKEADLILEGAMIKINEAVDILQEGAKKL